SRLPDSLAELSLRPGCEQQAAVGIDDGSQGPRRTLSGRERSTVSTATFRFRRNQRGPTFPAGIGGAFGCIGQTRGSNHLGGTKLDAAGVCAEPHAACPDSVLPPLPKA